VDGVLPKARLNGVLGWEMRTVSLNGDLSYRYTAQDKRRREKTTRFEEARHNYK
jgi:hypothetical protein